MEVVVYLLALLAYCALGWLLVSFVIILGFDEPDLKLQVPAAAGLAIMWLAGLYFGTAAYF